MLRLFIACLVFAVATPLFAKEEKEEHPGVKVGEEAPDFELLSQNDERVKLSKLLEDGPVAVVFHRSAQW